MNDFSQAASHLLNHLRTDVRAPDARAAADACLHAGNFAHSVSGMPLHFGSRHAPAPRSRVDWLGATGGSARMEWTRDRVDPVHHVWGRHRCVFEVRGTAGPDPFSLPPASDFVKPAILDFFENAFLQEAELGFVQALANSGVRMESASWVRLGPIWSARVCPDAFRGFFESHPDALLLHVPMEMVSAMEGPDICDDPFFEHPGIFPPDRLHAFRRRAGYRVERRRRLVLSGSSSDFEHFRETFPYLRPEFPEAGP